MTYDDETLMAYADGELDGTLRAEIDAAMATDPALANRVAQQRALRKRLAGTFAIVLDQPVPGRLETTARAGATPVSGLLRGEVLQFPARPARAPGAPWRAREWTAMAASLLIGMLLSWRFLGPADSGVIVAGKDALVARGDLALALDRQLASEQRGGEPVLIGLTFKSRDGSYCRSFMLRATRTAGLACRAGSEWRVPATDSSVLAEGGMQQATSAVTPAILRAIEARREGAALDAEDEKNAQLGGWEPKH